LEQNRVYTTIDGLEERGARDRILKTFEGISKWQIPYHHFLVASHQDPEIQMLIHFSVRRPLRIAEVTEALAIDLEQSVYDETQRFEDPDDPMNLCGSLTDREKF
jgi:hypothetical protein